jgi:hypothetical protein
MAKADGTLYAPDTIEKVFKVGELALATVLAESALLEIYQPGRVISSIFQTLQAFQQDRDNQAVADISDNSAHIISIRVITVRIAGLD